MKRLILLPFGLALICFVFADYALACQCGPKPTITDELDKYGSVVVVAGRIESVHRLRDEKDEDDYSAYRSATLVVDKVYAGTVKVGDRLVLAQSGGADCGFMWSSTSVGGKWLFYLGKPSTGFYQYLDEGSEVLGENEKVPMYRTSYCGRSTSLESAARDLAYLDNLTKLKGKTRVSGNLSFYDPEKRSVEGIEVRVTGKNTRFKTKYLKDGYFEFYDIPPGEYLLEVLAPHGWKIQNAWYAQREFEEFPDDGLAKLKKNQRYIRVTKDVHTDVDLALAPDTLIKGLVLSPTGKPMPKVCLSLVQVRSGEDGRGQTACADKKGEFSFDTMEPGNYLLIANPDGRIDYEQPFSRLYYPGVASAENAGMISVEAGKYNLGLNVQIPQTTRLIEIKGQVLFADDKPAKDVRISFEPDDAKKFDKISDRTDENGRFSLRIPFGAAGVIRGSSYFSTYYYSGCPEIMAVVNTSGKTDVPTTTLDITGTGPMANATLRFPFDFCEETTSVGIRTDLSTRGIPPLGAAFAFIPHTLFPY